MLTLDQLPFLTRGPATEALLGDSRGSLRFGVFERVKSTPNSLPVDAELGGKVGLVLTGTNTPAYVLDVFVGQFVGRGHALSLRSWDTSWNISLRDC